MALGLSFGGGGDDGEIIPIIKYDARAGRISRRDRIGNDYESVDITNNFKAVFDFENVEVGFICFPTGAAPDFKMVPLGETMPQRPSENHKQGVRLLIKLHADCGGDVRELSSNAKSFLGSMDTLHNAYVAGAAANPGKLPVVALKGVTSVVTNGGGNKATNYAPNWEIVGWSSRPADLVAKPRGGSTPAASAKTGGPPSTGSTKAAAPAADDDDFG